MSALIIGLFTLAGALIINIGLDRVARAIERLVEIYNKDYSGE